MEVILLEKITNLGNLGDKVNVKSGFGRNFLIPKGKALPANETNVKMFEERRAELEKQAQDLLSDAQARQEKINNMSVTINSKAGTEGKLFGSVGITDIAEALTEAGANVEKKEVRLPTGPFRAIGEYEVDIQLHTDVFAKVTVKVEPE